MASMVGAQALRETLAAELGSEFELRDAVGSGGFAVVFRARDHVLHRDVAVKVLNPSVALDEKAEERFRREMRLIAGLEHPNIVPVFRAGIAGRMPYMVMRFVVGKSLEQVLEERRSISWPEATRIAVQVADALAYAHARGVVHLDIKPGNLLLDHAQNVLVADFGIARAVAERNAPASDEPAAPAAVGVQTTASGTILYMSPEQALGEPVDARADVYALGVVLHQMLMGRVPFEGATPAATLKRQLDGYLILDASLIPPGLQLILNRALAPAPDDRYADAAALHDALGEFRASMASRSARRRVALAVGAVGVLVTLATAGGLLWRWASIYDVRERSPAIDVVGRQIPDSLLQQLRVLGAVDSGETVRYVFAPWGSSLRDAFVLTDRRAIRLTAGVPRAHALSDYRGLSATGMKGGRNAIIFFVGTSRDKAIRADTLFIGLGGEELASINEKLIALLSSR